MTPYRSYQTYCVHVPVKGDCTLIVVELITVNLLRVALSSYAVLNVMDVGEHLVYTVLSAVAPAAERNKPLVGFQPDRLLTKEQLS